MPTTPGPITQLAAAVNEGRLSASALVTSSIDRIVAADPVLNVMAERAFDDALAVAQRADREAWEPLLAARQRLVHAAALGRLPAIDVPFLDLRADGHPLGHLAPLHQGERIWVSTRLEDLGHVLLRSCRRTCLRRSRPNLEAPCHRRRTRSSSSHAKRTRCDRI